MHLKKSVVFAVIFALFSGLFAQEILKSTQEEYYDFLSLYGIVERPSFNYRTLSDSKWIPSQEITDEVNEPWSDKKITSDFTLLNLNFNDSNFFLRGLDPKISVKIYEIENSNSYNTAAPFGQNDGAFWQGKGYNTAFSTGLRVEGFGFELTVRPQLSFSQNKEFEYLVDGYYNPVFAEKASAFGYVWGACDAPQRFGNDSFWTYDWGDTEVRWSWYGFTLGFGTQSVWLGPAFENPLLHSNHAASYPKIDIGLRRTQIIIPYLNWYLGDIEARMWAGRLEESEYFDNDESNNYRLLTGFSVSYNPPFIKGLSIGVNKMTMCKWNNPDRIYYLNPFFNTNTLTGNDNRGEDMKASITVDWLFEKVQLEIYSEIGFDDFLSNGFKFYEYARFPLHTITYTVGLKKAFTHSEAHQIKGLLAFEWNCTEASQDYQMWPGSGYNFGFHGQINQGYTNKGQWLGSGIGYGGNSQYLSYTLFSKHGYEKFFIGRNNPDNSYIWAKCVDGDSSYNAIRYFTAFKANFYTGIEAETFVINGLRIQSGFTYNLIINPMYNPGLSTSGYYREYNYINNFNFRLGIKYQI